MKPNGWKPTCGPSLRARVASIISPLHTSGRSRTDRKLWRVLARGPLSVGRWVTRSVMRSVMRSCWYQKLDRVHAARWYSVIRPPRTSRLITDPGGVEYYRGGSGHRGIHIERAMGPVAVVVGDIALQDGLEMAAPEDEDAIQALAAQRPHEPFRERVRKRCPDRCADDGGSLGDEDLIEGACVFRVAVPDEKTERERFPAGDEVARLLGHPRSSGLSAASAASAGGRVRPGHDHRTTPCTLSVTCSDLERWLPPIRIRECALTGGGNHE
jgi:hypothetical protein